MKKTRYIALFGALVSAPLLLAAALPPQAVLGNSIGSVAQNGTPAQKAPAQKGGQTPPENPEDKDVVQILQTETREIAKNFYTVRWPKGKTCSFLVGDEGVLLIDTHLEQELYNIDNAIAAVTDKPVTHLINTHWHIDHTHGNAHYGETATVIAHENAKLRMEGSPLLDGRKAKPPMTGHALPDVTFKDKMELEFGGQTLKLVHLYGGHTDGDLVVWLPDLEVCVTGDIFYSHSYPFIDVQAGGDPFMLLDVADSLAELLPKKTMLIPGHGAPIEYEALTEFRAMLEGTMFKVQEGIDAGFNVSGIIEGGYLDEYKERWDEKGNATRAWVFALFTALKPPTPK